MACSGHVAHAQEPAGLSPVSSSAATADSADAWLDAKVRDLEIVENDLATYMKKLPAGLPETAKRNAVLFLALAARQFESLGLSGMADPEIFREADRTLSRALQRIAQSGPPFAKAVDQGERVLRIFRLLHVRMTRRSQTDPIDEWLGVASTQAAAAGQEPGTWPDPKVVVDRIKDLIAVYEDSIEQRQPRANGPKRTAPIYTAPLAELQAYSGQPAASAKHYLSDRLDADYIRHGEDYFFLADEKNPPPSVLVQYQKPALEPVAAIPLLPRDETAGVDWKGQVTLRAQSVRTYDARRPAGKRWQVETGKHALTFVLSRERGVFYVDAVETLGSYPPVALVTVRAKVIKALADQ